VQVVREWNDIKPEYEFRGYVWKGKLTGLSHYYKFLYVKELVKNKEKILQLIHSFWSKLEFGLEDYVIDFYVDLAAQKVIVIELNPFCDATSSALFNWDEDRNILCGDAATVFRLRMEADPDALNGISPDLRFLLEKNRSELDEKKPKGLLARLFKK
jgi:hypothetical protein